MPWSESIVATLMVPAETLEKWEQAALERKRENGNARVRLCRARKKLRLEEAAAGAQAVMVPVVPAPPPPPPPPPEPEPEPTPAQGQQLDEAGGEGEWEGEVGGAAPDSCWAPGLMDVPVDVLSFLPSTLETVGTSRLTRT